MIKMVGVIDAGYFKNNKGIVFIDLSIGTSVLNVYTCISVVRPLLDVNLGLN